jgi:uncharacterized phage-like protein YoqJ
MKKEFKFCEAATAAFTGHRWYDSSRKHSVRKKIEECVREAYRNGITNFISGMAIGFDLLAAEVVLSLRHECPAITLTAVLPFREQASRFNELNKCRYYKCLSQADDIVILSNDYTAKCYLERDRFMVEHSSLLIACYDGRNRGGTFWTVNFASRTGKNVINIY